METGAEKVGLEVMGFDRVDRVGRIDEVAWSNRVDEIDWVHIYMWMALIERGTMVAR